MRPAGIGAGRRTELEVEVETEAVRAHRARRQGRFLKGPIPLWQIAAAAKLPGAALPLLLAIHHQTALTGKPTVTLPRSLLAELGVSKDAKSRGLRHLEAAGLIGLDRTSGRAVRVWLEIPIGWIA